MSPLFPQRPPGGPARYHLLAVAVAVIWGTTLISTKILLQNGLTPAEIMFYRFLLAYGVLWLLYPHRHKVTHLSDEGVFVALGLFGGSLYFLTENSALHITLASNVALIVVTAPLLTTLLTHLFVKGEPVGRSIWFGSVVALLGVALVVYNGQVVLRIHPLGDILSLAAALSWAIYSVLLRKINNRYPVLFYTRKIFFYGILTLIPWFLLSGNPLSPQLLLKGEVAAHLLFLSLIASSACYVVWNTAVSHLGSVRTNHYIYLVPMVTLLFAVLFLDEPLTLQALTGAMLILLGVWFGGNRTLAGGSPSVENFSLPYQEESRHEGGSGIGDGPGYPDAIEPIEVRKEEQGGDQEDELPRQAHKHRDTRLSDREKEIGDGNLEAY